MGTYSNSKLSTFEQCRLKYKYLYMDKIRVETEATVEAFLGSIVHLALEKLYSDLKFQKTLSLNELLEYYQKIWKENWNDMIVIVREDYKEDNYFKMGEKMITEYYNKHSPFDEGKILGLETKDYLDLEFGYQWHIRIDRFMDAGNGVYEVHDYKTGSYLPTQEDADTDRQLAMYSLWVRKKFGDAKEVKLIWHFLSFNKDIESKRSLKELWALKNVVLDLIKEIESAKEFPPKISKLCDWCEYQTICPKWKHKFELEKKEPNEFLSDDGVKLVNEYVKVKAEEKELSERIEKQLEKLKEAILALAKKKGIDVLFGSDNKIKISSFETISFPPKGTKDREEFVDLLKNIGKYNEVLDIDLNAIRALVKKENLNGSDLKKIKEFLTIKENRLLKVSRLHD